MNVFKSFIAFFVTIIFSLFVFAFATETVHAAKYDLIAPSGQLQRGQSVQFTINIDTEGQSLKDATIGMTYQTGPLQYVSTTPGDAFPTVAAETQDGGKIIFKASNSSGFSGTGTFAVVNFKIIAATSGSAELCVLFNPETPTQPPPAPRPTALPKTGSISQTNRGIFLGAVFLALATGTLVFYNHKPYKRPPHLSAHRKTLHK